MTKIIITDIVHSYIIYVEVLVIRQFCKYCKLDKNKKSQLYRADDDIIM